MKRPILTCAGLLLCAAVSAQGSMTTPPGGLTGEGAGSNYILGAWPDMRAQLIDDLHTNGKGKAITEIAFRLDYRSHDSTTGMGRTWNNITVTVAELASDLSQSFSTNLGTSSTRVFDGGWNWPTQTGFPLLRPDVWSGLKGQLRFPFLKPWVYSARKPIVTDFTFRGGALANSAVWNTSSKHLFVLDSEFVDLGTAHVDAQFVPLRPPQCTDSALAATWKSRIVLSGGAFSSATSPGPGKELGFTQYSGYTAPNAPVIHALGLGGIPNGANIGAGCNLLYVDFSKPVILTKLQTSGSGWSPARSWYLGWQSELASLGLWAQAAWLDSKTGAFKLTAALHATLPRARPPKELPRFWSIYQVGTTASLAAGPYQGYFPYTRYKLQ